jgi:type IV pilus assembly protein PilB
MQAIGRPYGMILVTGPTGSGKTVSLYTCLNILNKPGVNISTAEDPAEIQLAGINQVNMNEKAGLSFAVALRAFLRQDPDIIMVGEIRDLETADIAIKAAQTGHLVLSTLHTNDAPTTLLRLLNMGVAPFNVASSVILITAQRLGRKLCTHCKKPKDIPPEALVQAGFAEDDLDGTWQPFGPVGCEMCKGTGYKGRVGIYQVMPITDDMRQLIMRNGNAFDIAEQAKKEGVRDLRQSGLIKVKQGLTSLEEIEAVGYFPASPEALDAARQSWLDAMK